MDISYIDLVDEVNKKKILITSYDIDMQKDVAVCMWNYVRDHLEELHDMLSDDDIDSYDIEYGYVAVETIKKKFIREFFKDTGIVIDWKSYCILCEKFNRLIIDSCKACPLGSCSSLSDNPYYTLVKYILHNESKSNALSAIESIIKAIREVKI